MVQNTLMCMPTHGRVRPHTQIRHTRMRYSNLACDKQLHHRDDAATASGKSQPQQYKQPQTGTHTQNVNELETGSSWEVSKRITLH